MKNQWDNNSKNETDNEVQPNNQGLFEKLLSLFGFEAEEVLDDAETAATYEEPIPAKRDRESREKGKLLALTNANKSVKMVIIEPDGFEEVQTIVDHLKNKQTVILNLEETDKSTARRIADFVSGAIYALEGSMQKVSASIFLFTPPNVEVTVPIRTMLKDRDKDGNEPERNERSDRNNLPNSVSSVFFRNDNKRRD